MSDSTYYSETAKRFREEGGKVLLFCVAGQTYGIEVSFVTEIIGNQHVTVMPLVPEYIKGVINLRGKVVPVISVRTRLGIPEEEIKGSSIVVVGWENLSVGLIVDKVLEVISVEPKDIAEIPEMQMDKKARYVRSILDPEGEVKLLLDCEQLIMEHKHD